MRFFKKVLFNGKFVEGARVMARRTFIADTHDEVLVHRGAHGVVIKVQGEEFLATFSHVELNVWMNAMVVDKGLVVLPKPSGGMPSQSSDHGAPKPKRENVE